jgi:basic amino acid/polyamine antiporter, APA family
MLGQVTTGLLIVPDVPALHGIVGAFMLAFFAFIGFESLVNLAEEVHTPAKLIPQAILVTLVVSTVLYMLVVAAALVIVPVGELAASVAPLSLVFTRATGASPLLIATIAAFAAINGVIAQIILASRVLYGLSRQGNLPAVLGHVHTRLETPVLATGTAAVCVTALALAGTLDQLADMTSRLMLVVFALVHAALWWIKRRGDAAPRDAFSAPLWVPVLGAPMCVGLLIASFAV